MKHKPSAATLDARRALIRQRFIAGSRAFFAATLGLGSLIILITGLSDGKLPVPLKGHRELVLFAERPLLFVIIAGAYVAIAALLAWLAVISAQHLRFRR